MPGSSENFDLIIRARDEASTVIGNVQQKVAGVSRETGALTSKLSRMVSPVNLITQSVRGFATGLLGVSGVLGIVSVAVIGFRNLLEEKFKSVERLNTALNENAKALTAVAEGNDRFAGYAKEAIRLHDEMTARSITEMEMRLDLAEAGLKEMSFLEKAISVIGSLPGHTLPNIFKNLSSPERITEIAQLSGALTKLRNEMSEIGRLGEAGPMSTRAEHNLEVETALLYKNALAWKARLEPVQMSARAQDFLHRGMRTIDEDFKRENTFATDVLREETLERERIIRESQERLGSIIESGMVNASAAIINSFFGMKANLAEIFKQMALDFERFFLNEIMRNAASSVAEMLLAPTGILSFLGLGKSAAGGGAGTAVMPGGTPRLAASGAGMIVVNFNGPIIGEEQYVRKRIIPQIERAAELNATRIALAR